MPIVLRGLSRARISYHKQALLLNLRAEEPAVVQEQASLFPETVSHAAFRLLEIASGDWFRTRTQLYKAANVRADIGRGLVDELHTAGLVTLHEVKTFDRGNKIDLALPTLKAYAALDEAHVGFCRMHGDAPHGDNTDATHIYYQNLIARKLRKQDWTVEIEWALDKKRVDVGAKRGPAFHAYEVVNEGLEKELSNLTQDLQEGWNQVVFCVGNEDIQKALTQLISDRIGDAILENVEFRLLGTFR